METKIYKYIYKNFTDYILQSLFQKEFKGFTIKGFKKNMPHYQSKTPYSSTLKRSIYYYIQQQIPTL